MKKYILISAVTAILVSSTMLIAAWFLGIGNNRMKIEHVSNTPVRGAMYTLDKQGEFVPLDFTQTAEKVINTVVHIKSTQTSGGQNSGDQRGMEDPFGNDLFERFFGPQFRFETPNQQPSVGSGSGVIISPEGYIVTNNHVIADADDIEVVMNDNRTYKAKLIGTDPTTDLALLQINENNLPTLTFMNSDEVKVGEWVLAVGNPFNLNSTITAGIVSAKARNIQILREQFAVESFIQTDAAINPGNSGGALVDLEGRLIGINTAIASPTGSYSGYGFAIPSNIVRKVIEDLIEFGTVQRGFIGVMIKDVNSAFAKEKNLEVIRGVYVDSLVEGGAAERAGLKIGDVIIGINSTTVNASAELLETVASHRPGDQMAVRVNRAGTEKTFTVTLNNKDGNTSRVKSETSAIATRLGAELVTISGEKARKLGIQGGVKVAKIKPGKLKKETNMKDGFIIARVNGQEVLSVEELERLLTNKSGGVMLEGVYEGIQDIYYYALGM
ncbi:MAG: Do family serine endopeptidase [Saprospiraceae bacterium]|nr:Do family serine endopeptidase [Saprospiraceae bacterium]